MVTYLYKLAFRYGHIDEAAAMSLVMFAVLLAFTIVYAFLAMRGREVEQSTQGRLSVIRMLVSDFSGVGPWRRSWGADLDERVVARLKERAKVSHRSLQGEVRAILEREARPRMTPKEMDSDARQMARPLAPAGQDVLGTAPR